MTIKTYTAQVAMEDGEMVLIFDPKMLEDLGWGEGDVIDWIFDQGQIKVKKANVGE